MQHTITCASCGNSVMLPEGRDFGFCSKCGTKLEAAEPPVDATETDSAASVMVSDTAGHAPQPESAEQSVDTPDIDSVAVAKQETSPVIVTPIAAETPGAAVPPQTVNTEPSGRRPRTLKLLVAAVAAVVVIAVCVIGFTALGGSTYEKAETGFIGSLVKSVSDASESTGKLDFAVQYEPSSFIKQNEGLSDIGLAGVVDYTKEQMLADLSLSAGGETISNALFTFDSKEMTLSLPQLTEYYLLWMMGGDTGIDISKLDQKKLQATLSNIGKAYFDTIREDTEVAKNAELTFGDVRVKCDVYTIEFTELLVAEIGLSIINELRSNENLMEFITDYVVSMGGEAEDLILALDEAYAELSEMKGSGLLFRMTVWVNEKKIIARRIDRIQGTDFLLYYMNIVNKDRICTEFNASGEGSSVTVIGDFKKTGGAWNGEIAATVKDDFYDEEILKVRIECVDLKQDGKQVIGKINMAAEADGVSFNSDITLDKKDDSQIIKAVIKVADYYETIDIGVITLTYSLVSGGKFVLPEFKEQYAVSVYDYSAENGARAEVMAEDIYNIWDSGDYDDNGIVSGILYELWYFVDDIAWYSEYYGYGETEFWQ